MKLYKLWIIFLLLSVSKFSQAESINLPSPWQFFCDKSKESFSISADENYKPSDKYFKKKKINWLKLLKVGPQKNQWGDFLKSGSRTLDEKCGGLKLRFSSGFLNTNATSELGAMDFLVIEIFYGNKQLLPPTALEQCTVPIQRYEYFGVCPERWAQKIEVTTTADKHTLNIVRVYTDSDFKDVESNQEYILKK